MECSKEGKNPKMRNDEKINIKIENNVSTEMSVQEKAEKNYETAKRYLEISELMRRYEDKDKYLSRGLIFMKKCLPYLDVKKEVNDLRIKIHVSRVKGRMALYEAAEHYRKTAKGINDYKAAIDLYARIVAHNKKTVPISEKLVGKELYQQVEIYSNAEEKIKQCESYIEAIQVKEKRKNRITSIIVLGIILFVLVFSKKPLFKERLGDLFSSFHIYSLAYTQYDSVYETTKDEIVKNKSSKCHYEAAKAAVQAKNYTLAFTEYNVAASRDYKDSRQQLYKLELERIDAADIGDYVRFGGSGKCSWKVLEKKDGQALLYRKKGLNDNPKPPFHEVDEPVTWENCTLRQWLNSEYLDRQFNEQEKQSILLANVPAENNECYGTNGGNDTKDKIFILSSSEYETYKELLPITETASWLRTPGNASNTMSIVNRYKTILDYGYEVSSTHFTIKPVLWVKYDFW